MLKFKKAIGSILMMTVLSLPMTVSIPVSADIISTNSLYTDSCTTNLTVSGKDASCISKVTGFRGKTTKIVITQTLQKKNSSGSWSSVKSSSKTENSYTASLAKSYSGLAKGTYRVKTTATVYSGNKSETVTSYSSTKTVR